MVLRSVIVIARCSVQQAAGVDDRDADEPAAQAVPHCLADGTHISARRRWPRVGSRPPCPAHAPPWYWRPWPRPRHSLPLRRHPPPGPGPRRPSARRARSSSRPAEEALRQDARRDAAAEGGRSRAARAGLPAVVEVAGLARPSRAARSLAREAVAQHGPRRRADAAEDVRQRARARGGASRERPGGGSTRRAARARSPGGRRRRDGRLRRQHDRLQRRDRGRRRHDLRRVPYGLDLGSHRRGGLPYGRRPARGPQARRDLDRHPARRARSPADLWILGHARRGEHLPGSDGRRREDRHPHDRS